MWDADAGARQNVSAKIVSTEPRRVLVGVPGAGLVYYDYAHVLEGVATQRDAHAFAAAPLVLQFLAGRNACLLAYGQTGSGKTHTMFGPPGVLKESASSCAFELSTSAGVVPRVVADVLRTVERAKLRRSKVEATVTFSYLELYKERITCLLTGATVAMYRVGVGAAADEYREACANEASEVLLKGALEFEASQLGEAATWHQLALAEDRKRRAATAMNARSSRAHTVFALTLKQKRGQELVTSKLYLVDLGGSEQLKKSKAVGDRLRETIDINRSLTTLGRVVDALVAKASHVPYYESRLTTLLQPAFGGNSKTAVLVSASPDANDAAESLASLRFGMRCARVQNTNESTTADMKEVLSSLERQIAAATTRVAALAKGGAKQRAENELTNSKLRGMGVGHAAESRLTAMLHQDDTGGDVTKESGLSTAQAHVERGKAQYSHVDDDAGLWLVETERLKTLQQRRNDIIGVNAEL